MENNSTNIGEEHSALYQFLKSKEISEPNCTIVFKSLAKYCRNLYCSSSSQNQTNVLGVEYYDSYMSCEPSEIESIEKLYDLIYGPETAINDRELFIYSKIDLHSEISYVINFKWNCHIDNEYELCLVHQDPVDNVLRGRIKSALKLLSLDAVSVSSLRLVESELKRLRKDRYIDEDYKTDYKKCPNRKPMIELLRNVWELIMKLGADESKIPLLLDFIESLFDSTMPNRDSIRTKFYTIR